MENRGHVVAVLPVPMAGGDEGERLVAFGLLEDICAELTRFPTLQVISWMSGLAVADRPERRIGEELGTTHVLRGRVERAGERLRVTANLVECARGTQLWSEQIDGAATDLFGLRDELVARIAATLAARLDDTALKEARRKPTDSLAAYELTLRGLLLLRQGTVEADVQARALFERALALDPHYARAQAGLSLSWFNEWSCQHWERFAENGRRAYEHAHAALALDDADPMVHVVIGRVHLYRRAFERASWYFDRALALCPHDAETLIQLAIAETYLGRPEVGAARAAKAMRLNPYHPDHYYAYAAFPHLMRRDFATGLELIGKAPDVGFVDLPAYVAIALLHLGRAAEAAERFAAYEAAFRTRILGGREPAPGEAFRWLLDINPFRRGEDVAFLAESFRRLGGATTGAAGAAAGRPGRREPAGGGSGALLRHGEGWVVDYGGRQALLGDLKGLHDLCRLLTAPGEPVHCLDLVDGVGDSFAGDAVLDETARQSLKARIRDLQEDLAEAEDHNDGGRAERCREELDRLVDGLSKALGLGGRQRRLGSLAERARTTVTWRLRHAVRKITAVHDPLGRHLANSLRTGTFCAYRPERPVAWRVD
ncbi:hypothetical protein [Azospirillum sp. ST 5-10]|uniref:hypothetical protein n=1 Tax=unclassified Azospirillum TaxID=2630922 RepID=UPI003F4A0844